MKGSFWQAKPLLPEDRPTCSGERDNYSDTREDMALSGLDT
jgi:hypothetical protein